MSEYFQIRENEILVIDQVPLINEARDDFEKAYQSIALLRAEISQHESEDLPAYTMWIHSTFGKQITQARDFALLIQEKETLVATLREQHWARFFGCPSHRHFENDFGVEEEVTVERHTASRHPRWQTLDDSVDEYGPDQEQSFYEELNSYYDDEDEGYFAEDQDSVRRFEEMFSRSSRWQDSGYTSRSYNYEERARLRRSFKEEGSAQTTSRELTKEELMRIRIKETYRILVRKLHPDLNPELTSEEKSLWNQVQAAYQERNLEQLDILLALSNVFSGRLSKDINLYQLRRATKEVERLVRPLEQKLQAAKKSRAWKFSKLQDKTLLQRELEKDFQRDFLKLKQRFDQLNSQLKRFYSATPAAN